MCLFGDSWTDTEPDLSVKTPNVLPPCNKDKSIFCNSTASWSWNILKNRHTFKNVQYLHNVYVRLWEEAGLLGERAYSDDMLHWKATDPRIEPVTFLLQGDSANHSTVANSWILLNLSGLFPFKWIQWSNKQKSVISFTPNCQAT